MSSKNRLSETQQDQLDNLIGSLQQEQLAFVEGYISGFNRAKQNGFPKAGAPSIDPSALRLVSSNPSLTILYGTHTGRSETVARKLSQKAVAAGISTVVTNMADYNTKSLKNEKNIAVIVSTHGEGDPPVQAEDFWEFIRGKRAPKLEGVQTAVLALGDKSYEKYCQTGIDIDEAFQKLGAHALLPIVKCDVDFEEEAESWTSHLVEELVKAGLNTEQPVNIQPEEAIEESQYSKTNPYYATVLEKIKLSGQGSEKEIYHIELSLEDSGLHYQPGDSIGIYSDNPPVLVNHILERVGFAPSETVTIKAGEVSIEKALRNHVEITVLNRDVLTQYAELIQSEDLKALVADRKQLSEYLYGHDLLDVITTYPGTFTAQQLVDILRTLPPRMYSISSSEDYVPEEVHITVAAVRYEKYDRERHGAASTFLSDRIKIDEQIPVFIDKNPMFKLPEDPNVPVIMVGPGTGVAPFRAFLQQREADNLSGKTWLFFGEQRFFTDFSYQTDWQKWLKKGTLEKLSVAFSRDQDEKIYVQHRIYENKKEVYQWLEKGAYFYICGDMKHMAKDVESTLIRIVSEEGNMTETDAKKFIRDLHKQKRYQLDVY